jgi:uncharacterized protein (TIGR01777 family)
MKKKSVLITGGTGLIGKHLSQKLTQSGYEVSFLGRKKPENCAFKYYLWDYKKKYIEEGALDNVDYIIHLAGANIGEKIWTSRRRKEIIESRVDTTSMIYDIVAEMVYKPKVFISASATGFYPKSYSETKNFTETDRPADDYLGKTCELWEGEAFRFMKLGLRTVSLRTGIVFSSEGGALKKMLLPIKFGLNIVLGKGTQLIPWIHIDDLCNIYLKAIEDNNLKGPYNAVSPDIVTYEKFAFVSSGFFGRATLKIKIPSLFLRILLGDMSEILLKGNRVSSEKIIIAGYKFIFPKLEQALSKIKFEHPF